MSNSPVQRPIHLQSPRVTRYQCNDWFQRKRRLKASEAMGQSVSNTLMRYVADPLSEDPGVSIDSEPASKEVGANMVRKEAAPAVEVTSCINGRASILKTLRGGVGPSTSSSTKGGNAGAGKVNVSVWKGVGGDDHVPGENCVLGRLSSYINSRGPCSRRLPQSAL